MRKNSNTEFKFLKMTEGEDVLAILGSVGIKRYGIDEEGNEIEKTHFHNLMEIGICRRGTGTIILDKQRYAYKSGMIVVIPQNYPHIVISGKEGESFWEFIYFKPSEFLNRQFSGNIKKKKQLIEEAQHRPILLERDVAINIVQMTDLIMNQFRTREYGYRECVKGLLYALIMEIIKVNHFEYEILETYNDTNPQKAQKLSMAMEYIRENYAKELCSADIAQACFVSETYLRRLFSEGCSISPMQYLNSVRIEEACKLIKSTDNTVNDIAYMVGFDNITTFINNFKKIVGCTPQKWRKSFMQKNDVKL